MGRSGITMGKLLINDSGKALVGSNGKAYAVNCDGVSGTPPLTFTAASGRLRQLLRYGKCIQSGTPTPSSPLAINCNNGVLTVVDDELPTGYKRLTGIRMQNARIVIPLFYLTGEDTLRFRAKGASGNWIGAFHDSSADDNYSFYGTTSATGKYARYNGQVGGSAISSNTWYDVIISPTGISGIKNPSEFTESEFTCSEPLNIGATSQSGSPCSDISFEGNIEVDGRLKLIPCERLSDNVLGYYDGTTFYTSSEGTLTSLGYDYSHLVAKAVGTAEALTLGSQSATVETLLQVGDYKDEQNILTGEITRRIGVKILTGSENWAASSTGTDGIFMTALWTRNHPNNSRIALVSNDYQGTNAVNADMPDKSVKGGNSASLNKFSIFIKDTTYSSVEDFKDFLAAQLEAGTPVIVLYPLDGSTTETVEKQSISTSAGQNTLAANGDVSIIFNT